MPSKSAARINTPAVSYRIPLVNAGATITATVGSSTGKQNFAWLQGIRSFSLHATGLQNPLATAAASVDLALKRRQQHVAKKSKIESGKETDPAGLNPVARATEGIVESKPKRKAAPSAPRKKKTALKKKTASASKPSDPKKASRSAISEPSDEEIRIRAYFIAERRLQLSLQGDSAHDWIEAKRQLVEEAKRSAS